MSKQTAQSGTSRAASVDAPLPASVAIAKIAWVRALPVAQAREAVVAARVRRYSAGTIVTLAGDDASLIAVLAGSVLIELGHSADDTGAADWQVAPLSFLTGASLVEGSSTMTITASSEIVVARWPKGFTFRSGNQSPQLIYALAGILGSMTSRAMQSTADLHLPTVERRCSAVILRLSEHTTDLAISQETLGQMANASRIAVGNALTSFARMGIVELEYRKVIVRNKLARLILDACQIGPRSWFRGLAPGF